MTARTVPYITLILWVPFKVKNVKVQSKDSGSDIYQESLDE
jgi:hypothetical protein